MISKLKILYVSVDTVTLATELSISKIKKFANTKKLELYILKQVNTIMTKKVVNGNI
jgi:hypothetical protein